MSESNESIFGVETKDVKPPKLPTVAQYVRQNKEPKSKPRHNVVTVWLPGQFDNITLQTTVYRVIITRNHPFYRPLLEFFTKSDSEDCPIAIRITDWENGAYQLEEPKGTYGSWKPLGSNGRRWSRD